MYIVINGSINKFLIFKSFKLSVRLSSSSHLFVLLFTYVLQGSKQQRPVFYSYSPNIKILDSTNTMIFYCPVTVYDFYMFFINIKPEKKANFNLYLFNLLFRVKYKFNFRK